MMICRRPLALRRKYQCRWCALRWSGWRQPPPARRPRTSKLILAVPSKGRLEENAAALFTEAGVKLKRAGARGYTGTVAGIDAIEVQYLSASEIAARLADGSVHFGITGEDLLREEVPDLDSSVQLVLPLGFGRADVVVAIPDGWVDVRRMGDLAEVAGDFRNQHGKRLRVATKYTQLAAEFFARHGLVDYVIVQSFGATEAAPNSGAAEAIVDITPTGATLVANQLRVPDDGIILKSEANFGSQFEALIGQPKRVAAKKLLSRLAAYNRAQEYAQITLSAATGMAGPSLCRMIYAPFWIVMVPLKTNIFRAARAPVAVFTASKCRRKPRRFYRSSHTKGLCPRRRQQAGLCL